MERVRVGFEEADLFPTGWRHDWQVVGLWVLRAASCPTATEDVKLWTVNVAVVLLFENCLTQPHDVRSRTLLKFPKSFDENIFVSRKMYVWAFKSMTSHQNNSACNLCFKLVKTAVYMRTHFMASHLTAPTSVSFPLWLVTRLCSAVTRLCSADRDPFIFIFTCKSE